MIIRRFLFVALGLICLPALADVSAEDKAELSGFTLDMPTVTRTYEAIADFNAYSKAHPDFKKRMDESSGDNSTLAESTAALSSCAECATILARHGFTAHQYILSSVATLQAGFAAAALKMGAKRDKLVASGVNPANLDFMAKHEADIKALNQKYPLSLDNN